MPLVLQVGEAVTDAVPSVTETESLFVVGGVLGSVGVVAGASAIVEWLKLLLGLCDNAVRWLLTFVVAWAVATVALTQIWPLAAVVFTGAYLVCFICRMLDAQHQARKIEAQQQYPGIERPQIGRR